MAPGINISYFKIYQDSGEETVYFSIWNDLNMPRSPSPVLAALLIGIAVFLAVESIYLLVIFIYDKSFRTASNIFVINSTLIWILFLPLSTFIFKAAAAGEWPSGLFACKYSGYCVLFLSHMSMWTMAAIAVDRYRVITLPSKPQLTNLSSVLVIAIIWIVGLAVLSPYFIFYKLIKVKVNDKPYTICTRDNPPGATVLSLFVVIEQFIAPLLVITVSYVRLWRYIKMSRAKLQKSIASGKVSVIQDSLCLDKQKAIYSESMMILIQQREKRNRQYRKLIKSLILIVMAFVVMWMPLAALFSAVTFDMIMESYRLRSYQMLLGLLIMSTNIVITPIFYLVSNSQISLLCCKKKPQQRIGQFNAIKSINKVSNTLC